MLALGAADSGRPDRYPLQKARTTKCTGATGDAFRWSETRIPLPRDFKRYPQQIDLEQTLDWKAKIVDAYKATARDAPPTRPSFCDGASPSVIARMEETLACRMPMSLRSLLSETDGVTEELEIEHNHWLVASIVIYSVDEMIDTNLFMRREYRDHEIDRYCFFSTAGTDGIQFGMPAKLADQEDASVFAWYPDGTPDKYMADGLLPFLQGWCAGVATV